jgi:hypothetical protein
MRVLRNGKTGYWREGTLVIRNPKAWDGGTAYRPLKGYAHFLDDLGKIL